MISFKHKGDFANTTNFLRKMRFDKEIEVLEKYGKKGVEALANATPVDTGLTASSWYYQIVRGSDGRISLQFCNSNVKDYVPIAVIIQYGHASRSGTWVEGQDYINPAIKPVFDEIADRIWKEVTR